MNKIVIVLALIALSLGSFSCGGGGAGGPSMPPGENSGVASVVQLLPSTFIAQTNSSITLHTKVLDGNGIPVANIPVYFTNLSHPFGILSATVKNTDSSGIATVTLFSSTPGFATILAQVNTGVGQVRDRKSVFFSMLDVLAVSMSLDVDSDQDSNTIYNEPDDFILFQSANDDEVSILATVFNAGGLRVAGESVSWSSSHTEAGFVRTETETNLNGQAKAVVKVTPTSIRDTETHVNIMAFAGNGAVNMVTLFLRPVVIDPTKSLVTANPTIVDTKGTSAVTAIVVLNTGARAPDGTVVNFTTAPKTAADPSPCGTITPFVATTGGITTPAATFTAPLLPGTCTVTAKSGGVTIGSVDIIVKATLTVMPSSVTLHVGGPYTFTITGGVPPYNAFSSDPTNAPVTTVSPSAPYKFTLTINSGICTIVLPATSCTATVTITVQDAIGATATATVNVINP